MQNKQMDEALEFCVKHKITITQFLFLYFLRTKDLSSDSVIKKYVDSFGKFNPQKDLHPLEDKGFIENMNSPGKYVLGMFMLTPKCDEIFADEDCFDELWKAYPKSLPLSGGSSFIARSGMDKEDLARVYLKTIGYSRKTHKIVLNKLRQYVEMVREGKINGHKISQFVKQHIWESVPEDHGTEVKGNWGKDV